MMGNRRGVSPVLGVIILMGIALAGGVILTNISNQLFVTGFNAAKYQITELTLQKDSGGSCYLFVSLYNSGSVPVNSTLVEMKFDNGTSFVPVNSTTLVLPGKNFTSFNKLDGNNCNFTLDSSYGVRIHGLSNNSSFATTSLVKVKEVPRS